MQTSSNSHPSTTSRMSLLSRLLLPLDDTAPARLDLAGDRNPGLVEMSREEFDALATLAHSNHVVIRAFAVMRKTWDRAGDATRAGWAQDVLAAEQSRIRHALPFLQRICGAFHAAGLDITVMKSLDHWPDLGSDLDLFSGAAPEAVISVMKNHFGAEPAERSWGDRLAHKWNFVVPGLPEMVEFHIGRLGQTGEQRVIASRLPARAQTVEVGGESFPVTCASDRLMISTLQRMYRHFYFRLCDVIDSATLVDAGRVDFDDLQRAAIAAGIWPGVATYLVIVSDYVESYGNPPLALPREVRTAAQFGGRCVFVGREFLRVPILPQSAGLYRTQLMGLLRRGAIGSGARLSLLPWLATAAFLEQKRTGSDKGIW